MEFFFAIVIVIQLQASYTFKLQSSTTNTKDIPPRRKKLFKLDKEWTYGERQQWLINTYHDGHFKSIQNMERLLKECLKQFEQVKDPKLQKSYQSLIRGVKRDLLALRNNTEEVLKNTELMKEGLDSLT